MKSWKILNNLNKVREKDFSGVRTKSIRSYIIATVEQKPNNVILNLRTCNLNKIDTPEEATMTTFDLAMICKMNIINVLNSGLKRIKFTPT